MFEGYMVSKVPLLNAVLSSASIVKLRWYISWSKDWEDQNLFAFNAVELLKKQPRTW